MAALEEGSLEQTAILGICDHKEGGDRCRMGASHDSLRLASEPGLNTSTRAGRTAGGDRKSETPGPSSGTGPRRSPRVQ